MRNTVMKVMIVMICNVGLFADGFEVKPIKDFAELDKFASVPKFEAYVKGYVQECLDNSYGGSLCVRCFIESDLWDRELNKYYKLLYRSLDKAGKAALKDSQLSWLKTRDKTIKFNNYLLDKEFTMPGTMYIAIRAGQASDTIAPIIKERALLLKKMYEDLKGN